MPSRQLSRLSSRCKLALSLFGSSAALFQGVDLRPHSPEITVFFPRATRRLGKTKWLLVVFLRLAPYRHSGSGAGKCEWIARAPTKRRITKELSECDAVRGNVVKVLGLTVVRELPAQAQNLR